MGQGDGGRPQWETAGSGLLIPRPWRRVTPRSRHKPTRTCVVRPAPAGCAPRCRVRPGAHAMCRAARQLPKTKSFALKPCRSRSRSRRRTRSRSGDRRDRGRDDYGARGATPQHIYPIRYTPRGLASGQCNPIVASIRSRGGLWALTAVYRRTSQAASQADCPICVGALAAMDPWSIGYRHIRYALYPRPYTLYARSHWPLESYSLTACTRFPGSASHPVLRACSPVYLPDLGAEAPKP